MPDLDTSFAYRAYIAVVLRHDEQVIGPKDEDYGGSWQKDGGIGAWFNVKRKWDRLQNFVEMKQAPWPQYDIFLCIKNCDPKSQDTILDTIGDLRRYLTLVEAYAYAAGWVPVPGGPGLPVPETHSESWRPTVFLPDIPSSCMITVGAGHREQRDAALAEWKAEVAKILGMDVRWGHRVNVSGVPIHQESGGERRHEGVTGWRARGPSQTRPLPRVGLDHCDCGAYPGGLCDGWCRSEAGASRVVPTSTAPQPQVVGNLEMCIAAERPAEEDLYQRMADAIGITRGEAKQAAMFVAYGGVAPPQAVAGEPCSGASNYHGMVPPDQARARAEDSGPDYERDQRMAERRFNASSWPVSIEDSIYQALSDAEKHWYVSHGAQRWQLPQVLDEDQYTSAPSGVRLYYMRAPDGCTFYVLDRRRVPPHARGGFERFRAEMNDTEFHDFRPTWARSLYTGGHPGKGWVMRPEYRELWGRS